MKNRAILFWTIIFLNANVFAQVLVKQIKPSDTDPLITTFNTDSNYVYLNTGIVAKNILVVHLPGSYGEPKRATLFGKLAANLGFHSIGLMYPNVPTVGSFCNNSSDTFCYENVRREIIDGIDHSNLISINETESILNRLKKLIIYLKSNYPSENWEQYLDTNNDLIFSKIIFSGHSQGGGHAALIAKYFPIKRALCFSSPKDYSNYFNSPPLWLSTGDWKTPKSKIYSFEHTLDNYAEQLEILDSLGINDYGDPINVDLNSSPYQNTLQLTTSYAVPSGDEHSSTIQDNKTPKISGSPVFLPVWTYMLTDNLVTGLSYIDSNDNLLIYPNPTNNIVNIDLKNDKFSIAVYDQAGKKLIEKNSSTGEIKIEFSNLNSGIYFLKVNGDKISFIEKVVKL